MLIAFMFTQYEAGDENYNIDSLVNLAIAGYEKNTGIKPLLTTTEMGFSLYPNPATGGQFILSPANLKSGTRTEVSITNVMGQTVQLHSFDNLDFAIKMDIGNQPPGVYLVQLKQGNFSQVQKLVVSDN
jgi:hypothetical protein